MSKRFYKSNDKKIAGVCGGIADYFDWDPTIVRVLWGVLTLCTAEFPGIIAYLILALTMPNRPSDDSDWDNMKRANDYKPSEDAEFNSYFEKEKKQKKQKSED